MCGAPLVLSTYLYLWCFSRHATVNDWKRITADDGEHAQCTVIDTYVLHVSLYVPNGTICLWRKKIISHHRPFFCLARLVHFRHPPTLFIVFARNRQNLSKLPVIRQIIREQTLWYKNVQCTDESIANWHHWLGQLHPQTICHFWRVAKSVQNKWQKTVWTLLAKMGIVCIYHEGENVYQTDLSPITPRDMCHSDWFLPNSL